MGIPEILFCKMENRTDPRVLRNQVRSLFAFKMVIIEASRILIPMGLLKDPFNSVLVEKFTKGHGFHEVVASIGLRLKRKLLPIKTNAF